MAILLNRYSLLGIYPEGGYFVFSLGDELPLFEGVA